MHIKRVLFPFPNNICLQKGSSTGIKIGVMKPSVQMENEKITFGRLESLVGVRNVLKQDYL